jgi:hypothetical protein
VTEAGLGPSSPAAVTKAYDIVLWLVGHVGKFPRSHRFVLGERIETAMLDVLLLLVEAAYERDKIPLLRLARTDRSRAHQSREGPPAQESRRAHEEPGALALPATFLKD